MKVLERFESHIIPVTESGCWLWDGYSPRYGRMKINNRDISAHRLSWTFYRGEIPEGMCVLHKCDVMCCVNPDHLFIGTNKDNTTDMFSKGRNHHDRMDWKGKNHYSTHLTESDVMAIFSDLRSLPEIGAAYGINKNTVWNIKHCKTWKHLNLGGK